MNQHDKFFMLKAMSAYGGGFVVSLASAWGRADPKNSQALEDAFPDLMRVYGPGSRFFDEAAGSKAEAA